MDIVLTFTEIEQFQKALLDAFERPGLIQVVSFSLDTKYDHIVKASTFLGEVHDLILWVNQQNKVMALLKKAREQNPGNVKLREFEAAIERKHEAVEKVHIFEVPLRRNRNFSGRKTQLTEIERRLAEEEETILAITGLGGLGKTQLALEYCYRERDTYDLIYWLRADEAGTLGASLAALAQALGLVGQEASDQEEVRKNLLEWLENTEARWLLVYDNADTMKPRELNPYLPRSGNGHVLITSRNPKFGGIARVLELGVFEPDEALAFLQKRSGRDDEEGAADLAESLGYLPLALEHAAAFVYVTGADFATYQEYYEQQRQALWADIEPLEAYHGTINTTWELSLEHLQEEEIQLLELCSFLAPDDIPMTLLQQAVGDDVVLPEALQQALENPLGLHKVIAGLSRFSLLARADDVVVVNRLIQEVTRDHMGADLAKEWVEIAISLLLLIFPEDKYMWHTWHEGPELLPHAAAAAGHADRQSAETERVSLLYNKTGYYLQQYGDYAGARPYLERALAIREEKLGPLHPDTAESLNNLGSLLHDMGEYKEARPYLERALAIREEKLGSEHPDTAESLTNLGSLLQDTGTYEEARLYYERALAIDESQLGPRHPDTATDLNNLGLLLQQMEAYEEARRYLEQALVIRKEELGPDHPQTAESLNNLGLLLQTRGMYEEARPYLESALAIFEEQLGLEHSHTAASLSNLGRLLKDMEAYEEARPYLERALAIDEAKLGPDHPHTATSLFNLGTLLEDTGAYDEARMCLERALAIDEAKLGPEHPHTVAIQLRLGKLLQAIGAYEEARPYLEQTPAITEEDIELALGRTELRDFKEAIAAKVATGHAANNQEYGPDPDIPYQDPKKALIDELLRLPITDTPAGRTSLLHGIPGADMLNRENNSRLDIDLIVTQLAKLGRLAGGELPLVMLINNALPYAKGYEVEQRLKKIRQQLLVV